MDNSLEDLFGVSMAINDLTLPKTVGGLDAYETQKLRHRLLALGYRYTNDTNKNIFTHIASEASNLRQETQGSSEETPYLERRLAELHAKLGAGLNVVAQSHSDYDSNILMSSLENAEKTQRVAHSAFQVLEHDPRPSIQHWTSRFDNNPSHLDSAYVCQPVETDAVTLKRRIDTCNLTDDLSSTGQYFFQRMQDLKNTSLGSFTKGTARWRDPCTVATNFTADSPAYALASGANVPWLDIVNGVLTGIDFVGEVINSIATDTVVEAVMGFLGGFVIDAVLDSWTFGLWTIGKFVLSLFFGGLF